MSGCLQINSRKLPTKARQTAYCTDAASNFEFIISHVTAMKCLSILKALSIRQKQDITIMLFKHTNILTVLRACCKLRHQRRRRYTMSSSAGGKASIESSMLYVQYRKAFHRRNVADYEFKIGYCMQ